MKMNEQMKDMTRNRGGELPEGWVEASIGSIAKISSGKFLPRSTYSKLQDKPFAVAGAGGPIGWTDNANFKAPVMTLGRVGTAGALNVYQSDVWVTDNALVVQPMSSDYFAWIALFFQNVEWIELQTGSSQPLITQTLVKKLVIPLPPLPEQHRIVAKIDELLTQVNAVRGRLERVAAMLKRFRQAVLSAACSGKLTEGWREEKGQTQGWVEKTGEEVFSFVTSGSRGWAKYYSNTGALFLRVGNLDHQTIELDLGSIQRVQPPAGAEGKRTRVQLGDILISITADVGMVGFIRKDLGEAYINQHLCLARQTGEYLGDFLAYYLASPEGGLAQLTTAQRGVTKAGLTLGDIRQLTFSLPPLPEQHEIVRRVESLFALADRIESRVAAASARAERLTQAILAKAFRGELVPTEAELGRLPQEPTVEPEPLPEGTSGTKGRGKKAGGKSKRGKEQLPLFG